ncbi:hypothetical protein LQE92_10550 [Lacrimispora sp. NSJ-141]|uniref:Uncharacterized protein n=1 Tax=Lientehia hominis TaxID=2897778 RepID=A0AAP2RK04_9FIRM|nr:hypothetical protein [Lientehia hominis]MCD2493056.1 hypothetical protein [Lientehia hominis]
MSVPITRKSHLHTNLGFDSLAFVSLFLKIKEGFQIFFGITKIDQCPQNGAYISSIRGTIRAEEIKKN